MYRIDNSTAVTPIPTPAAAGVNPNSFFTDGNPSLGVAATLVSADWANSIQEELCNVVEGAGITLVKSTRTQLLAAIKALSQQAAGIYAASTTAANSYTATLSPVPASYTTGMFVIIKFTNHNTGSATINLNSLGAKSIRRLNGSNLSASDILDGMVAMMVYDGTNFQIINIDLTASLAALTASISAVITAAQTNSYNYAVDTGTANSYAIALTPAIASYTVGQRFTVKIVNGNTQTSTLNVNSLGNKSIVKLDGTALTGYEMPAGMEAEFVYDGTNMQLLNPFKRNSLLNVQAFAASGTYTPTPGMKTCKILVIGGGGGAGGVAGTIGQGAASGGGGGGGWAEAMYTAAQIGASQTVTIGAGGTQGNAGNNAGGTGGTTSVGSLISATGGAGSPGRTSSTAFLIGLGGTGGIGTVSSGTSVAVGTGNHGGNGVVSGNGFGWNGWGGATYTYGSIQSTRFVGATDNNGVAGINYGTGASGGATSNGTSYAGAAGAGGFVVVEEYA